MAKYLREFQQRRTYNILVILFVIDLVFLILHVLHKLTQYFTGSSLVAGMDSGHVAFYQNLDFDVLYHLAPYVANPLLNIEVDNGYAESYQHVKFIGIIIAFSFLCIKEKNWTFAPWVLLFTYFLLDDSLQLHERLGTVIASGISFVPFFELRRQDLGELSVTVAVGLIILPLLLLAYYRGRPPLRHVFRNLALILSLLVFFGVGVDIAHVVVMNDPIMSPVFAMIEDGGELMSVSLFAWYAFALMKRASNVKHGLNGERLVSEALAGGGRASFDATNARSEHEKFA